MGLGLSVCCCVVIVSRSTITKDLFIAHVIIIIKSEVSIFRIVIIFFRGCVTEMFVASYSVTYYIYIPGKLGFCSHQYSLCHGMDIGTCDIVHWSAAPHNRIANRTGFWLYVVLVLNVIRYSCHYFLDRILFHHDFHHDSCGYHWDFYGH